MNPRPVLCVHVYVWNNKGVNIPQKHTRGFTLIELLVVIAVFGILTSVILGSVNSARDKSIDATVKMNLKGTRDQMALYYDDNGLTYADACASDPNIANAVMSAREAVSSILTLGGQGDGECVSTDAEWAVWINLKSNPSYAWCIDSVGTAGVVTAQDSSAIDLTVCP